MSSAWGAAATRPPARESCSCCRCGRSAWGGEGPSACAWGGEALARRLYRELRACLGEGHDILIALYTAGGVLGESYLNGVAQSRAAV